MSNVVEFPVTGTPPGADAYTAVLRDSGREITEAVAAIADGRRSDLIADDDRSRLVVAMTLLAAGLPLQLVASQGTSLRAALDGLIQYRAVELYLLQNGLRIDQFHALRERLHDRGDAA